MIPKDNEEDLLTAAINFLRAVTEAYGPDDGMKLWAGIADTIDAELKGKIFFAVLTGQYNSRIVLSRFDSTSNRIARIKSIRTITNLGLKEAKDLDDGLMEHGIPIVINITPGNRAKAISDLRAAGYSI